MRNFTRDQKNQPGTSRTRKAIAAAVTAAAAVATAPAVFAAPAQAAPAQAAPISGAAALAASGARQASAAAFRPGSGRLVVTWNNELIKILGIPGEQPAAIHPTRSFALLQAAEYDAVNSVTHRDRPYLFTVRAARDARPDAAADQAAHDVLAALYPDMRGELGTVLRTELAKIGGRPADGTEVGAAVARHLLVRATTDPRPARRRSRAGTGPGTTGPRRPASPPRRSPAGAGSPRSSCVTDGSSGRRRLRR